MRRSVLVGIGIGLLCFPLLVGQEKKEQRVQGTSLSWFKGNTHTHTTMSDGDSPPEVVIRWYKEHGYHFLVLSDHNVLTNPKKYASFNSSTFLLVSVEEITDKHKKKPVHINALNIRKVIPPQRPEVIFLGPQRISVEGIPTVGFPTRYKTLFYKILEGVQIDSIVVSCLPDHIWD